MKAELLYKYRATENQINDLGEEILMLRSKLTSIKATQVTDMPKAMPSTEDHMADAIAKICEMQEKWAKMTDENMNLLSDISEALNRMPDVERRILKYKFVHGWTWDAVATKVGYSDRGVRKARKRAIRMFEEIEL